MVVDIKFVLFITVTISQLLSGLCDEILGCGGFIKSDSVIDYSRVEIKLYTKQNSLKDHTECAPNGYYFLPLYDKGEYIIKVVPPDGWSFEPEEISVKVDGISDQCSKGQDINFSFKGFSIIGKVISEGFTEGPAGVTLRLKKGTHVLAEMKSKPGGSYIFTNILPGDYVIEASHDKWVLVKSIVTATVAKDNGNVGTIIIKGYNVEGQVTSDKEPVKGVKFILFSDNVKPEVIDGCNKGDIPEFENPHKTKPICHVVSSEKGIFSFSSLPPGEYTLIPLYKNENIKFDVHPAHFKFTVAHNSVKLNKHFEVKGFSVSGNVSYTKGGKVVSSAKVFVENQLICMTDMHGKYHLEGMKTGTYILRVELDSEDVLFDPIQVKISPSTPFLQEITASSFKVCGQIMEERISNQPHTVILTSTTNDITNIDSSSDGTFCTFLKPGKYEVKVRTSADEQKKGIRFSPTVQTITVHDSPVSNVIFSQFKAHVMGKVTCLVPKCDNVDIMLKSLDSEMKPVTTEVNKDNFEFDDVLPGEYELSVVKPEWCWKEISQRFAVTSSNIKNLKFEQSGYMAAFVSTHETNLKYTTESGSSGNLVIQRGTSRVCLSSAGVYSFKPVSCHVFSEKTLQWDSNKPKLIQLTAVSHLVTGDITSPGKIANLVLKLRSAGKELDILDIKEIKDGKSVKYTFEHQTKPGEQIEFQPSSENYLFYPPKQTMTGTDDCQMNAIHFQAKIAKYLKGHVQPSLQGATVTITSTSLPKPITLQTDAKGNYVVGPLDSDSKYEVSVEKSGYVLTRMTNDTGSFIAQKLGEIVVTVVDENKNALGGVLLSLSGGRNYRQNSQTKPDGQMVFGSLSPGDYFLRPMMKEYKFQPNSQMIKVEEVETVEVVLVGKRVAFSVSGTVMSLTGDWEAGVVVEAVGKEACKEYQEEATSEPDGGFFRIRGLQPRCVYELRLKQNAESNEQIERSLPSTIPVQVENEDISGLNLIVFHHSNQLDVTGLVETPPEHLKTLKVKVFQEGLPESPIQILKLERSPFFFVPPLIQDVRQYVIQLESSLSRTMYKYECPEVYISANASFKHVVLHFNPQLRTVDQEIGRGSYLTLPLLILLIAIVLNYQQVIPALYDARTTVGNYFSSAPRTERLSDAAILEPIIKRKIKPRKT